jgi:Piwi domain
MVNCLQGLDFKTFYINGRAPDNSTAKPVRFICVEHDAGLKNVSLERLTWAESHNYPNWPGPIKVPSVCQMAHKLAELAGSFSDCGESIDAAAYKNKVYFL